MLSNKFWRLIPAALVVTMVLAACGGSTPAATTAPTEAMTEMPVMTEEPTEVATEEADPMAALIEAAKAEGQLTTIALPHDWCNYGEALETFKAKYGLTINELNPDAGSGDEVEAIKANKDNPGPQAPDVIDVGFPFTGGPDSITAQDLVQPYKVATWDTIPEGAKDPDGMWTGDYYGLLTFLVNTDVITTVPKDWADLKNPEYKSSVALSGDPRASNQAIQSVFAASLGNGGSLDDAQKGLDLFAELNKAGNLVPVISNNGLVAKGETPIRITWDYLALAAQDEFKGNPKTEVVFPASSPFAGVYVQAISKYAPHPNAAKLWLEFLYSDEGQLLWLKGYCHPIRYTDLAANNKIPADLAAKLPAPDLYAKAVFPSGDQLVAAKKLITEGWDAAVGADVKAAP